MEAFTNSTPESRAALEDIQNRMVALLNSLQTYSEQHGEGMVDVEESEMFLQQALSRISVGTEAENEHWLDDIDWKEFGKRFSNRAKEAGIQQKELAGLVGVTPQTIRNIWTAKKKPSRELMLKLLAVPRLRLRVSDIVGDAQPALVTTSWFATEYDPRQMIMDMRAKILGSGDSLEQSTAYLDPQSAADWLSISLATGFVALYSNTKPLEQAADIVTSSARRGGLTVVALGSGDARREVTFAQFCANKLNKPRDLMLRLLDISHTLLTFGYKHAEEMLGPLGVSVMTMHANFHDLSKYPIFGRGSKKPGQRVFTLLGNTLANLDNEVRFFRDTLSGCVPGDYFLADFTIAHAPADKPDEIRLSDPVFQSALPEARKLWLSGPLWRYGKGVKDVDIAIELETNCMVRGSYETHYVAKVSTDDGLPDRRFSMFRIIRYDSDKLIECLEQLGWKAKMVVPYASNERNKIMLMLLQKQ